MTQQTRYELWRAKLSYLIQNHGGLSAIARATGLKPKAIERIVDGATAVHQKQPAHLDPASARLIEKALDLNEGWFDEPAYLPSRL
jgi:hypothetical protein